MDIAGQLNWRRAGHGGYCRYIYIALVVSLSASAIGFDRERAFYPTVLIVIASYYGLFAVMGGSVKSLLYESVFIAAFIIAAILGFKLNLWFVVGALLTHGVFDFYHGHLMQNPGVPLWWPKFCLAYDTVAAAYLAGLLVVSKLPARKASTHPTRLQ
jgi:hypothetical protein